MTKYNEAFKRQVVQEYLSGQGGFQSLGNKHGIDGSMLRRWVMAHAAHGDQGLRKKHETYSAEFKMSGLQHMWRHDLSYQRTSAVFDLREPCGVCQRQLKFDTVFAASAIEY